MATTGKIPLLGFKAFIKNVVLFGFSLGQSTPGVPDVVVRIGADDTVVQVRADDTVVCIRADPDMVRI